MSSLGTEPWPTGKARPVGAWLSTTIPGARVPDISRRHFRLCMARGWGCDPSEVGSFSRDHPEDAFVKIAVVVPARNGAAMVTACVAACLAQTLPPDEVVVVDNSSNDETAVLAASA